MHGVNNELAQKCSGFTAVAAAIAATTVATFIYMHVMYHTNQMHLNRILTFCSLPLPLHCRYILRIHTVCPTHNKRSIALISISMMLCTAHIISAKGIKCEIISITVH